MLNTEKRKQLFDQLNKLDTEQRNQNTVDIDLAEPLEIARKINEEDKKVAHFVEQRLEQIAEAIDMVSKKLQQGGRLIYAGAGTSGRLGVLDAVECPPTFGSDPDDIFGIIAGGKEAMFVAQEGAEDKEEYGEQAIKKIKVSENDVVCGIAASGRTPYVLGAVKQAKRNGAGTLFICTVPKNQLNVEADIIIDVPVGPEVIMGSTRMKSGTAQKMVLNMITTGAMIRQGKVLENVMVDLQSTNQKLEERSKRIVMKFTGLSYHEAEDILNKADGHVKTALVMSLASTDKIQAKELLAEHNGFIRKALHKHLK